jgi:type VI secretion system protein ImpC
VTTSNNPDNLTLRYFPFKASSVKVTKRAGEIGWYDCSVSILPHIQFEGMNVELRLDSRLGSK